MSESSAPYEDEEPPKKKAKRTKSTTVVDPFPSDSGRKNNSNSKSTQRNGSKMLVVSVDFTSNDNLRLGGVPLSQLSSPTQAKGRRSKRSTSMSSHSNSIPEEVVSTKPVKINFKNPKFCVSLLPTYTHTMAAVCICVTYTLYPAIFHCEHWSLQFTYLAGNKKKTWKNFKQIMTAEKSLTWRADDPRCE